MGEPDTVLAGDGGGKAAEMLTRHATAIDGGDRGPSTTSGDAPVGTIRRVRADTREH